MAEGGVLALSLVNWYCQPIGGLLAQRLVSFSQACHTGKITKQLELERDILKLKLLPLTNKADSGFMIYEDLFLSVQICFCMIFVFECTLLLNIPDDIPLVGTLSSFLFMELWGKCYSYIGGCSVGSGGYQFLIWIRMVSFLPCNLSPQSIKKMSPQI